ncbi:MAG: Fe-S cluster assembly protein SufD [Candidatus Marinimicrobia bacterium]|nr:Fe-S cluster assembly protein SufD [Candidatus Neomarinimicrobiota bacterium]
MLNIVEQYADEFRNLDNGHFSKEPVAIQNIRISAMERFTELGFPNNKIEEWKNTNLGSLTKTLFKLPSGKQTQITSETIVPFSIEGTHRLVILNGKYLPELSNTDNLLTTLEIKNFSEAIIDNSSLLAPYLGKIADYTNHPFVALNTAFMDDGIFIHVPDGQVIENPIHLLYISSPTDENTVFHLRNMIIVGVNSEITIIEDYVGLDNKEYFTNVVTEMAARENGTIHHIKIQQESTRAHHISNLHVNQDNASSVSLDSFIVGSSITRNDISAILNGEGADCKMNGLVLAKDSQHIDNHTILDHAKPHGTSNELFKGIYTDKARGIFNGRIIVRKNAQKTDARQTNKNLLLSDSALVNSNPQLEIYADDVKCTHGSTTGQLEEEALFYLRTRGLDIRTAQALLLHGFADQILNKISNSAIKAYLESILSNWLSSIKT